ncbi:HAD-IB family hydrolase [Asticcacaulis sp. YBE204]|uniref:HAD-IB family hydrolase n=1 Tax=Asticcacaulis sp. YBE204 TaxID=1282363 RepID=UPI0003C3C635|nr:HAD-IB family hydrolase [Asticcacaulis sp. YBE204]ESQ77020.1 hypothetical protein AEYBE204_18195 [Asticcacaulis sp. YBE204]
MPAPAIHAFDFDGTLTYTDSFTAFLLWECGHAKVASTLAFRPYMLAGYLKTRDRGALKSHLLFNLLGRISRTDLEAKFVAFAQETGPKLFRPDAMETWETVKTAGTLRVIVTASPELLVGQFGQMLGADRTIGTLLAFDAEDRLMPDLDGPNCRGDEKMNRLGAVYGDDLDLEAAYGDTSGDFDMIKAARNGHYRVFVKRP